MSYFNRNGVSRGKLMAGLQLSGLTFTLQDAKDHQVGDATKGPGKQGKFTISPGYLAHYEVHSVHIG